MSGIALFNKHLYSTLLYSARYCGGCFVNINTILTLDIIIMEK